MTERQYGEDYAIINTSRTNFFNYTFDSQNEEKGDFETYKKKGIRWNINWSISYKSCSNYPLIKNKWILKVIRFSSQERNNLYKRFKNAFIILEI
ncbi:hypothetical protein ACS74_14155 [Exiguobacterium acetylicum]|nr:hypothetical protein ACS74_14155 [Exiguobacterium acetylicum]